MKKRTIFSTCSVIATAVSLTSLVTTMVVNADEALYQGSGAVTKGVGKTTISSLFECKDGRARVAAMGEIVDTDGKSWTLPAINHYLDAPKAMDMYEQCSGHTPRNLSGVDVDSVPLVTVDDDGEIITGYIFADNYFELYINGQMIGVDSVPFTPFNSSIVKFKVSKPYTIAIKLIDWEENLGVGSERGRGKQFQPGDGGLIASFSDGNVTNADWKAQNYYIAPIYDLSCIEEKGSERVSAECDTSGRNSANDIYAVHWPLPENWSAANFDSSSWPNATTYTEDTVGVNNKPGYMNFQEKFSGAGATFIWSNNLILDNEVLVRYTVE